MKPPPFEYQRARTVDEAVALLADLGAGAKVLAGGQSLVPMMNFRLVRPNVMVDINEIPDLAYVRRDSEVLCIGAMTRHVTLEDRSLFIGEWDVVPRVARYIGHYPIRVRGTVGGSIVHADPAAELPVLVAALDGELVIRSRAGARVVPWRDFFTGPFQVALEPEELLTEVRLRRPPESARTVIQEFSRRAGDFALGVVIASLLVQDGICSWARVAVGGLGGVVHRAGGAEQALVGRPATAETFRAVAHQVGSEVDPVDDIHASVEFRRHLVEVLVDRSLTAAASSAA